MNNARGNNYNDSVRDSTLKLLLRVDRFNLIP